MIVKNRFIGSIITIITAILLIILGILFTVTLVFAFVGIPLIVFGLLVLLAGIFSLFLSPLSFLRAKPRKDDVITLEKKDGVYKKK